MASHGLVVGVPTHIPLPALPTLPTHTGRGLDRHLLEDVAGDHETLHLRGTLVDLRDACVAVVPLDRVVGDVARTAQNLHRLMGAEGGSLGRRELRHRRLLDVRLAHVLELRGPPRQQPRLFDAHGHVRDLELDGLQLGDRLPEGDACLRVLHRGLQRRLRDPERLCGDADPPPVERLHGDLKAHARGAKHVLLLHADILQDQRARPRRSDPELVLGFPGGEARRVGTNKERRDALVLC
mmetsp:Transcript_45757/g.109121  ORF Transcript_45757/g.109121 Transcript_45757/m.109121 type:complete len:239 (+) Transcript_45757:205-921(+)